MWADAYIGIPYLRHGYDRQGADCWGLLCMVMAEVFGHALPRHDVWLDRASYEGAAEWTPVPLGDVEPGDVLHMWGIHDGARVPLHCGVIVEPGLVLHTEGPAGSIIEDYRRKRAAWRPIKAVRLV